MRNTANLRLSFKFKMKLRHVFRSLSFGVGTWSAMLFFCHLKPHTRPKRSPAALLWQLAFTIFPKVFLVSKISWLKLPQTLFEFHSYFHKMVMQCFWPWLFLFFWDHVYVLKLKCCTFEWLTTSVRPHLQYCIQLWGPPSVTGTVTENDWVKTCLCQRITSLVFTNQEAY